MTGAGPSITHRPAEARDAADIARLEELSFAPAWSVQMVAESLAAPGTHAWVAIYPDGRTVGFALFRRIGEEAELLRLATEPNLRRRGIGSGLLAASLAGVRELAASSCWLEVRIDNLAARRLYERTGFRLAGRRPGYYADGVDALVYRLTPIG